MEKIIPTLDELAHDEQGEMVITLVNIDDIFRTLAEQGYKEVRVNRGQMLMIAMFIVANVTNSDDKKVWETKSWELLTEGKIDKFLGVKIKLI